MSSDPAPRTPLAVDRHIETVADLERQALDDRSAGEHVGDAVAARIGTMGMVAFHCVWFAAWVIFNLGWVPGIRPFDPFPFGFLTLVVSLEAIFLSLFLLISQNRLTRQSDRRTHLDLQVNLLIETEVTKVLLILGRVCDKMGIDLSDEPEMQELATHIDLRSIVHAVESEIPEAGGGSPSHAPPPQDAPADDD